MLKYCVICLVAILSMSCVNERDKSKIVNELREWYWDEMDGNSNSFSKNSAVEYYQGTFNLSNDELDIVGEWLINNLEGYSKNGTNDQELNGIAFLPNRLFYSSSMRNVKDSRGGYINTIEISVFGLWKIEKGSLEISPRVIVQRSDLYPINSIDQLNITRIDTEYFPVWKYSMHSVASMQKKPFTFSSMPNELRTICMYPLVDSLRVRVRRVLQFSDINTVFNPDKPWHNFLLKPDLSDDNYLFHLYIATHFLAEVGRGYDFNENSAHLDFSTWDN